MNTAHTTSFLIVCASVALAAPAHAGRKERRFFRLTEQAQERFDAEDYEGALTLFEKALALKADPVVRFNIAVCLDRLERSEEAVARYAEVEADRKSDKRMRAYAKKRGAAIEEARRERLEQERLEKERREKEDKRKKTPPIKTPPEPPGPPVAAWALTGAGGLAVVAAGVLWGFSGAEQSALGQATRFELRRSHQERARTYALAGDVTMVAGLVIAGVGAGMWWSHTNLKVEPTGGPDRLGVRLSVSF